MDSSKPDKDTVEWVKILINSNRCRERLPEGKGWKTIFEIIDASPLGVVSTRKIVTEGCRSGEMEAFEGTIVGPVGKMVRRIWYRPKKT